MLGEVFIKRIAGEAISKYKAENRGKNGVAKADVIRITMKYGGDMDDVREAMVECIRRIAPQLL